MFPSLVPSAMNLSGKPFGLAGMHADPCAGKTMYNGDLSRTFSSIPNCDCNGHRCERRAGCFMKVAYGGGEVEANVIADDIVIDGVL